MGFPTPNPTPKRWTSRGAAGWSCDTSDFSMATWLRVRGRVGVRVRVRVQVRVRVGVRVRVRVRVGG